MRKPKAGTKQSWSLNVNGTGWAPPELAAINRAYHQGTLAYNQAEKACRELLATVRPPKPSVGSGNLQLFERWWIIEAPTRKRKDLKTAENDYLLALSYLGNKSALGNAKDLESCFHSLKPSVARRLISRINELRGPNLPRIRLPEKQTTNPDFLFLDQVRLVAERLPELADFIWTLFGTGARVGEAIGIQAMMAGNVVPIDRAWQRKEQTFKLPKRGKTRTAPTIGAARPFIKNWLSLSEDEKKAYVNVKASETITAACKELFPDTPAHHCDFHDLRHSYAYHCLTKGMSMRDVALALGDRIEVVEEYYTGWQIRLQEAVKFSQMLD